jgi:hypothetical protein
MKTILKWAIVALLPIAVFSSCKKDTPDPIPPVNPWDDMVLVHDTTIQGEDLQIRVFSDRELYVGYNNLFFLVTDAAGKEVLQPTAVAFSPLMEMSTMNHACPYGQPEWDTELKMSHGYCVFSMPSGALGTWFVDLNVSIDGVEYQYAISPTIAEPAESRMFSFIDLISTNTYIVALIEPMEPKIGVNDFVVGFYVKETMMSFPEVANMNIEIEPEMPTMGHGSPNNVDPVYTADGRYEGKVNFTMSGYWKVNMLIKDSESVVIKDNAFFDITF